MIGFRELAFVVAAARKMQTDRIRRPRRARGRRHGPAQRVPSTRGRRRRCSEPAARAGWYKNNTRDGQVMCCWSGSYCHYFTITTSTGSTTIAAAGGGAAAATVSAEIVTAVLTGSVPELSLSLAFAAEVRVGHG
ncbi:hypothetical protein F4778DRAFT_783816 [Xylariomycetidae sp. FL2044]|nr:hypothetical protein F4778DRAFT_783816 [Xylariomycetidae sp. FL2044]